MGKKRSQSAKAFQSSLGFCNCSNKERTTQRKNIQTKIEKNLSDDIQGTPPSVGEASVHFDKMSLYELLRPSKPRLYFAKKSCTDSSPSMSGKGTPFFLGAVSSGKAGVGGPLPPPSSIASSVTSNASPRRSSRWKIPSLREFLQVLSAFGFPGLRDPMNNYILYIQKKNKQSPFNFLICAKRKNQMCQGAQPYHSSKPSTSACPRRCKFLVKRFAVQNFTAPLIFNLRCRQSSEKKGQTKQNDSALCTKNVT